MVEVEKIRIKCEEDIKNLREIWEDLENGKDMTIYQSYSWNQLLYEEYRKSVIETVQSEVNVYILLQEEIPVMVAPFIIQKKSYRFTREKGIYFLGHRSWSDYNNFIYKDINESIITILLEKVKNDYNGFQIFLTDVPDWTESSKCLVKMGTEINKIGKAVAIKIRNNTEEYYKILSKHVRQNLRTSVNRLNRNNIKYELIVKNDIHDENLLDELRRIYIARAKAKCMNNTDLLHIILSKVHTIFRNYKLKNNNIIYQSMQKMEQSYLVIIYLDKKIVGYLYGLKDRDSIRIMQNCFLEEYAFYSPLFYGAYDFIRKIHESGNGIVSVDFTRGNESYKYSLGGEENNLNSFIVR